MWLQQEGLQLSNVARWDTKRAKSWRLFHKQHAKLRLVSKSGNLSMTKEARLARAEFKRRHSSGSSDS
jgi:hypothetical protein